MPERGRIGIFNRSYYEEVLIARVHPEILVNEERTPPTADPEAVFEGRYKSIRRLEKHLHRNGAKVVKIFLHLSREEQRQRFLARIEQPGKSWKLSLSDMQERRFWPQYQEAYEKAIGATASKSAPWWVVPADDKESARLIVSQILVDALTALDPQPPKETAERKGLLQAFKTELEAEAAG
jgi:polyphosphate kinase 2 (PPK2 family)